MLWYTEPLMITSDAQQARLTDGLRLHVRHGQLISVLVRMGAAERSYLALDGCPGCAIGRCQPGCHAALLQRLLHSCTATPPLRLVQRGLAQRSYSRVYRRISRQHVEGAMVKKRQRRSGDFKFRVALEAMKEQKTLSQLASEYEVHPGQITQWKKQLLNGGSGIFDQQHVREFQEQTAREAELFEQIGRLQMDLAWLKKNLDPTI